VIERHCHVVTRPSATFECPPESNQVAADLRSEPGDGIDYTFMFQNGSRHALNGAQAVLTVPEGVVFQSVSRGSATENGQDIVVSLGRLAGNSTVTLHIRGYFTKRAPKHLEALGVLRSGTALPVVGKKVISNVRGDDREGQGRD
jgi:uncharacterized repeat protein (TIGR01451 family)